MAETEHAVWIWILLNLAETALCFYLIRGILPEAKQRGKAGRAAAVLIVIVTAVLIGGRYKIGSMFSSMAYLYGVLILTAGTWLIYRSEYILTAGIVLTYSAIVMLLVYLAVFFVSVFQTNAADSGMYYFFGGNVNSLFVVIRFVVLFAVSLVVWRIRRSNLRRQIREYRIILLITGTVLSGFVLEYQNLLEYGFLYSASDIPAVKSVLRDSMLSLVTSVALTAVLGALYLKNRRIRDENDLLLMKEEMERQKYEELRTAMEQNRELVHDTKNHYLVLSEYERNREYGKLHSYLEELKTSFVRVTPTIYTGNQILDLILSQKRMTAKRKGITTELHVTPLSGLPFEEREICSLFGNLLDNAAEACEKAEGRKEIRVRIEQQKQMLFIRISNTITGEPERKGERFSTWKKDRSMHGYGLKSVERIVRAHDGVISYQTGNGTFTVTMTFFEVE